MADSRIANIIIDQIQATDMLALFAYGTRHLTAIDDGVMFSVSGLNFKGIVKIALSAMDDYTITLGKFDKKTSEFNIKQVINGVYCDQLVAVLDDLIEKK